MSCMKFSFLIYEKLPKKKEFTSRKQNLEMKKKKLFQLNDL